MAADTRTRNRVREIRFRHRRYGASVAVLAQSYGLPESDILVILTGRRMPAQSASQSGAMEPPPRGTRGRHMDKYGYVWTTSGKRGTARLEHRVVMEGMLGRALLRSEAVHHKNHIKHDNRPENLELMTRGAHTAMHNRLEPKRKRRVA